MAKKIIIWDFSWIQNYLFDIRKNKSATKRLKWRSVFIEMLLEKIKEELKNKLWNCEDYLVSWWKFILLCENFNEWNFNNLKKYIETKLFKQFYGELKIIFWLADWKEWKSFKDALNQAYEEVEKNKLRSFETVLIESRWENQMSSDENKRWNEKMFVFWKWENDNWFEENRWPDKVCKFSRDRLIDKDMTKIIQEEIWKDFFDESDKWISYEAWLDLLITKGIIKDKFAKEENKKIKLFQNKEKEDKNDGFEINLKNIKYKENYFKWVPVFEKDEIELYKKDFSNLWDIKEWDIKPFDVLATKIVEVGDKDWNKKIVKWFNKLAVLKWFNKLAVLKWDIDNLWETFQFGLKENDYKRNYEKLSTILDNFWKKELYNFIESNEKYKNKLYVVYAGWDDFVILWRWDLIIKFYKDLLRLFKEKIKKNNEIIELLKDKYLEKDPELVSGWQKAKISFSWAINLFWAHDTFFTVVKQTEELLKEAKDKDEKIKNKVNIFRQIVENKEFIELFEEAEKFYSKFVKTDIVSVWTLRFLLDIGKKIKLEDEVKNWKDENWNKKEFFEYWLWKSELYYHLWRNYWGDDRWWKQKISEDKKEKVEFRKYIDWMLLKNEITEFKSLIDWNDDLFKENKWEKLIVMMHLVLYWRRDKN